MNTKTQEWPKWRIIAEIHARGWTLSQLALHNGRTPSTFSHVWKRPNSTNEKIVADCIGQKLETLWPDRYPKDSHYIYDSKKHGPAQSQKSKRVSDRVAA